MKKLLILIVAGALFLHFNPQPSVEAWYQQQKALVIEIFSKGTDTKVRLKAAKIYDDLQPQFYSFSPDELTYLQKITANREAVKAFYEDYCQNHQDNPKLHPSNLTKVCKTVYNYEAFL
ncbi:hypothetical protein [Thalassomonas sp. RHCl1]|uniref:hypothetical protein n=1 Tax=Thalassomonas sp. RHCl1 TaxID=2995320 RepID=UPI00248B6739|nr:hypothetical protein [Thalassomonas sp. RHCl1]